MQQLGSSVGLFASAYQVRFRLEQLLRLFRGNIKQLHEEAELRIPENRRWSDPVPRFYGDKFQRYELVDRNTERIPAEMAILSSDLKRLLEVGLFNATDIQPARDSHMNIEDKRDTGVCG